MTPFEQHITSSVHHGDPSRRLPAVEAQTGFGDRIDCLFETPGCTEEPSCISPNATHFITILCFRHGGSRSCTRAYRVLLVPGAYRTKPTLCGNGAHPVNRDAISRSLPTSIGEPRSGRCRPIGTRRTVWKMAAIRLVLAHSAPRVSPFVRPACRGGRDPASAVTPSPPFPPGVPPFVLAAFTGGSRGFVPSGPGVAKWAQDDAWPRSGRCWPIAGHGRPERPRRREVGMGWTTAAIRHVPSPSPPPTFDRVAFRVVVARAPGIAM